MNKLMVKTELLERFKNLFTISKPDLSYIGNIDEMPLLIPKRWFGESGNIAIPMRVQFDKDWQCEKILIEKAAYDEMLTYFEAYDGKLDGPMLRKVFEFPAEHAPETDGAFRLVCHLRPDDAVDEPKVKPNDEPEGGYVIEI